MSTKNWDLVQNALSRVKLNWEVSNLKHVLIIILLNYILFKLQKNAISSRKSQVAWQIVRTCFEIDCIFFYFCFFFIVRATVRNQWDLETGLKQGFCRPSQYLQNCIKKSSIAPVVSKPNVFKEWKPYQNYSFIYRNCQSAFAHPPASCPPWPSWL